MNKKDDNVERRKEKVKNWLKDPYNLAFIGLFITIILVYVYYFFKLASQPIWWDEGDYLAIGKELAFNRERPDWWMDFTRIRPLAFPLILAFFFKFSLSEVTVRFFTELLPSLISIFLIYVIGKELFNKKIGLISALLFSVNWVYMFYSFRFLTDIPSLFFSALAFYFFWVKYEKPMINGEKPKPIFLWLAVAFGIFSFLIRYIAALTLIVIVAYLLLTRKFSLFKDKNMWIAGIIGLLCLSPYAIYNYETRGNIFPAWAWYHGAESTAIHRPVAWNTLTFHLPNFFKTFELVFFVIGFILILDILFYLDIVFRQKDKSKNNILLCLLGVIIPIGYFIFGIRAVDARYFIATAPLMFTLASIGINSVAEFTSKIFKIKYLYILILILLLSITVYEQMKNSNEFINSRSESYKEIQQAGLWIKENSLKDAKVITVSVTQMQHYTERMTYSFNPVDPNDIKEWDSCYFKDEQLVQRISTNETCMKKTEALFNKKIKKIKPTFYVIHGFEPVFTPQWAYDYPQRYNLTLVQLYSQGNQPILAVYQFPENFTSYLQ